MRGAVTSRVGVSLCRSLGCGSGVSFGASSGRGAVAASLLSSRSGRRVVAAGALAQAAQRQKATSKKARGRSASMLRGI
jgi:hypothetical protein